MNYMCLSSEPQYGQATPGQQTGSAVFRTEYRTSGAQLSTAWNARQNYEAPCVVCQAGTNQQFSFVQPGSNICPTGFSLDYTCVQSSLN